MIKCKHPKKELIKQKEIDMLFYCPDCDMTIKIRGNGGTINYGIN